MVGITVRSRVEDDSSSGRTFSESLESLLHTDRIESTVAHESERFSIGYAAYPEYPIRTFENDDVWVCFEGCLYDRAEDSLERTALDVGASMLNGDEESSELDDWLVSVDGEFVVLACDKSDGRLAVLNDALGRLPLYYYNDGGTFVISRDLRYVIENVDVEFDALGAAQCLLLGYSLGDRTLVQDISRIRPGTLCTAEVVTDGDGATESIESTVRKLHEFDFDDHRYADRSRERNAMELVTRFTDACRNRSGYYDHDVVSLSGGLDSRSVLAGYHAAGLSPTAATMESPEYVPASDVDVAEQIASDFGIDWQTYRVSRPRGADLDTLVKTKNGQIGLITSFILDFFRQLEADYGTSVAYITGDGGDKVLPDLTPTRSLTGDELTDYIVAHNSVMDLERVSNLTGVTEEAIRRSIREHVDTYPESTPSGKYVHFLLYERGVNFLFEGEDRNRHFFWSVTPFYSLPFFRYAMNCPPDQKKRYKLYRTFLYQLAPTAADRVHTIYGAPINSSRHAFAALVDDVLSRYPTLFETVKPFVKSFNDLDTTSNIRPDTIDLMRTQAERNEAVDDIFDRRELNRLLDSYTEYNDSSVHRVLSLTSVVDDLNSTQSVLEANPQSHFA